MTEPPAPPRTPWVFAVFLIVVGAVGWWAAFNLTLDKFTALTDANATLNCDVSLLVQCSTNLKSAQGSVFFGIPNPIWGISGFVAPIAVGVALLAGARFARWFWILFNIGVTGALVFVMWLIGQSIFVLGTLCPWCMLVWSITIPLWWTLTLRNASTGVFGRPLERVGRIGMLLVLPLTVLSYGVVVLLAQVQLDALARLLSGNL